MDKKVIGYTAAGKPIYEIAGGAPDDNRIDVEVMFHADMGNLNSVLRSAHIQMASLASINSKMSEATGKLLPALGNQVLVLRALAAEGNKTAESLVNLTRSQGLFYTAFSGNVKQNLAALFRNKGVFQHFKKDLVNELSDIIIVSENMGNTLTTVADDITTRFRIMTAVSIENLQRLATRLITVGKQAQWVGRQLIVGVTLPVTGAFYVMGRQFLEVARAQTELAKFLVDSQTTAKEVAEVIKGQLEPAFERLSIRLAQSESDVTQLAAAWVAAGFDNEQLLGKVTRLTAELAALTQGDLELADAQELVRSIMATFFDTTEDGIARTERSLQKLQVIQSTTSLQMRDIAESIPIVSSVAKTLGILPEEIAAMLAGMRQMGVQASVAANALKFGLARLAQPTDEAARAFEDITGTSLGRVLFEGGVPRGIRAIEDLAAIFEDLNQEQKIQLASLLFGNRQYDRFLKLIQAIRTPMSDFNRALDESSDTTRATAFWQQQLDVVLNSVQKRWERFKVQIQVLMANFGEAILPQLEDTVRGFISLIEVFDKMPDSIKQVIVSLASLGAVLGPIIYSMAFITKLIPGNLLAIIPFIGRKFLGVRGIEMPGILNKLPLLGNIIGPGGTATGPLSTAESAAVRRTLGSLLMLRMRGTGPIEPETLEKFLEALPTRTMAEIALGGPLSEESLRFLKQPSMLGLTRGVIGPSGKGQMFQKFSQVFGVQIADATATGVALGATSAATNKGIFAKIGEAFKTSMKSNMTKGVEEAGEQMKRSGTLSNIIGLARGLFTSFERQVIVGKPSGRGFAGILLEFTSALPKFMLLLTIAIGVLSHWRKIWEGLAPSIERVREIFEDAIGSIVGNIVAVFDSTSDTTARAGNQWVKFGRLIGRVIESISKTVAGAMKIAGASISYLIKLAKGVFDTLSPVVKFIGDIFSGFSGGAINAFKELAQGIVSAGRGIDIFTANLSRLLAVITTITIAQKILRTELVQSFIVFVNQAISIIVQLRLRIISLSEAFMAMGAAMKAVGWTGWLIIISLVVTAINFFINRINKAKEAMKDIREIIAQLRQDVLSFYNSIKGLDFSFFTTKEMMDDIQEFKSNANNLFDSIIEKATELQPKMRDAFGEIPFDERVRFAAMELTSAFGQVNKLTAEQMDMFMRIGEQRLVLLKEQRRALENERERIEAELQHLAAVYSLTPEGGISVAAQPPPPGVVDEFKYLKQRLSDINQETVSLTFAIRSLDIVLDEVFGIGARDRFTQTFDRYISKAQDLAGILSGDLSRASDKAKEKLSDFADALRNQLGQATDRLVSDVLDMFDRTTDQMLESFDRATESMTGKIDKQIEKIQELNDTEEWAQRQREYRLRREEMIRNLQLGLAIAAVERARAIVLGDFDQAKLISLQMEADRKDAVKGIRELDRQHRQEVIQRRRQERIDRLEAQRDRIEAMREQEREALQEQRDIQRTLLSNMLDDLIEFGAKTKEEWIKLKDKIIDVANDFGIRMNEVNKIHIQKFGRTIVEELNKAIEDAKIEAREGSQSLGKTIADGITEGISNSEIIQRVTEITKRIYEFQDRAIFLMHHRGLTVEDIMQSEQWRDFWTDIAKMLQNLNKQVGVPFHGGGYVSGSSNEVPAVLQPGEYVIRRDVVKRVGRKTLDMINDNEPPRYHSGGFVGGSGSTGIFDRLIGGQSIAAQTLFGLGVGAGMREMVPALSSMIAAGVIRSINMYLGALSGAAVSGLGRIGQIVRGKGPFMVFPVAGNNYTYSDTFGAPRPGGRTHQGIDIIAPMGTPVLATFPGTVEKAINTLGGLAVRVRGAKGYTYNAHFSRFGKIGRVSAGDIIGYVGQSGNAIYSVPHLHFEWHPGNGVAVNPYQYLRAVDPKLQGARTGGIVRFNTPAMLHAGEVVIPEAVARSLSRAGSQPPVVNINVNIEGDIYGDESSYRRLYDTLERVARRVTLERGNNNVHVEVR